MGTLFLAFAVLVVLDAVTLGGFLLPRLAPALRGWALAGAAVLAAVALVQGLRPPVVVDYEVKLAGLPAGRDGTVLVELSDLHLGTLIGEAWMARLVDRVDAMKPDLIVVDGDLIDGNVARVEPMVPVLRRLAAPLGVWAVTGNHEFYAGLARSVKLFEDAGFHVLQDRWAEVVPGLVLAGVDDLTARRQFGLDGAPVERALAGRPAGATVLLSHTPWQAERAAGLGAGLMLSGHTHDGQIWPFGYLVRLTYPLLGGRYRGRRHDRNRMPRHRHVGTADAPVAPLRDRPRHAQSYFSHCLRNASSFAGSWPGFVLSPVSNTPLSCRCNTLSCGDRTTNDGNPSVLGLPRRAIASGFLFSLE